MKNIFFFFILVYTLLCGSVFLTGSGSSRSLSSYSQSLWNGVHRPRGAEMDAVCADMVHRPLRQGPVTHTLNLIAHTHIHWSIFLFS